MKPLRLAELHIDMPTIQASPRRSNKEWVKRSVVLTILILFATLMRMISEKAGISADPWAILGKVASIAGATSVVYFVTFFLADRMLDDRRE